MLRNVDANNIIIHCLSRAAAAERVQYVISDVSYIIIFVKSL